jgi:hypothetical protein
MLVGILEPLVSGWKLKVPKIVNESLPRNLNNP